MSSGSGSGSGSGSDTCVIEDNATKKTIGIQGKHSRYLVKKLTQKKTSHVARKKIEKWNIDPSWFLAEKQLDLICNDEHIVKSEIVKKIASYKQQDIFKKRLDVDKVINYGYVKRCILDCKMLCHYCNEQAFVLYETRRDMTQWTVDRIDNNIGHDIGNIVIACLQCNLQRKTRNADKFLQTKQLVIRREHHVPSEEDIDYEINKSSRDEIISP